MLKTGKTNISLIIARTVRYNVNDLTGPFYYQTGVYDYDNQSIEIASKENDDLSLRPALSVFQDKEFGVTTKLNNQISIDKNVPTIDIKTADKNSIVVSLIGLWDYNTSVNIFSANGQQLKYLNNTISKDFKTFNIQNNNGYANGLYFVTISDSKKAITKAITIF